MSLLRLRAMKTCLPGPSLNPFLPLWLVTELMGCFKTPAFAFFSHEKNKWSGGIDAMTNQEHVFVKPSKCRLSKKKKPFPILVCSDKISFESCFHFLFFLSSYWRICWSSILPKSPPDHSDELGCFVCQHRHSSAHSVLVRVAGVSPRTKIMYFFFSL